MPGVRLIEDADVLLVSVRRRGLGADDLGRIRRFVGSGKPVLGIRTASHAFAPKEKIPTGHESWESFDAEVFGGNYTGHHGSSREKNPGSFVQVSKGAAGHPVVDGLPEDEWKTSAWLYKTSPLKEGAQVLAMGRVEGVEQEEPLAWTFVRRDGGRSFYTSLGHADDFADPRFQRLLVNAIYWVGGFGGAGSLARTSGFGSLGRRVDAGEIGGAGGTRVAEGGGRLFAVDADAARGPEDLKAVERSIRWPGGTRGFF